MLALFIGLFCTVQLTTYLKNEWCLLKNNTLFIRQLVSKVAFGKAKPFLLDYVFINYPRFTDSVHVLNDGRTNDDVFVSSIFQSLNPPSSSKYMTLLTLCYAMLNEQLLYINWLFVGRYWTISIHCVSPSPYWRSFDVLDELPGS